MPSPWKPLLRCHFQAVYHGFRWKHKYLFVKRECGVEIRREVRWGGGVANGSEVCRLKSVDNRGLALPSPSRSFSCVVSTSSAFLLFCLKKRHTETQACACLDAVCKLGQCSKCVVLGVTLELSVKRAISRLFMFGFAKHLASFVICLVARKKSNLIIDIV